MSSIAQIDNLEHGFQTRWHQAYSAKFAAENDLSSPSWREQRLSPRAHEAQAFIDSLRRTRDLSQFQLDTDRWVRSFQSGYAGTAGQMVINQINKMSEDKESATELLVDVLVKPTDIRDAQRKISRLVEFIKSIQVGSHPHVRRAAFVCSYYWALEDPDEWPVAWPKSTDYLENCTGNTEYEDEQTWYTALFNFVHVVADGPREFEQIPAWWADEKPVIIDPVLCDRAKFRESADKDVDNPLEYFQNARALIAASKHIGQALSDPVSQSVGRKLKPQKPALTWDGTWPRGDMWVDWKIQGTYGLGIRIWLNSRGVAIGLRPYADAEKEATTRALSVIEASPIAGYRVLAGGASKLGADVGFVGGGTGEVIYGRWFDRDTFDSFDLAHEVLRTAKDVAPLLATLNGDPTDNSADDELSELVSEFKNKTGYPTAGDEQDEADRRDFANLLDPDEILTRDRSELPRIWSSGRYGSTGPMSTLNRSIRDADTTEYQRILGTFKYICWGDDSPAERLDRALTTTELRVPGLGESVMMKLLAVTQPERFITVYPFAGSKGKSAMLDLLGISIPDSASPGENQIASNDALRSRLEHLFPNDSLGMGRFLYWLSEKESALVEDPEHDPLDELADELLVDRSFIEDIVELLEDKKQVVFYGPPGTGKTYFARKLAEALVPEAERRPIVQFHPSTSYEDFFEGYRPDVNTGGNMTYKLQPGPLAQLAERAHDAPGGRHLMIIDEINRANLPKVFGELLFLLEYRDTPVRTLYRPDEPFELSKDIWFIGTMNTADRSIALIDAALRRRFHFIPFFPNRGPMAGLLDRWLAREGEPAWVGELVAQVNDELERALGGPHLQLGPSHFMKHGLKERSLQRIWEYDIEPFIEDQFFGDTAQIRRFRFPQVWERFADVAPESLEGEVDLDETGY